MSQTPRGTEAPVARTPHLVRDSEIRATLSPGRTHHTYYISKPGTQRRRQRTEETWARRDELGNGTFGCVWLEQCESGPKQGQLRAVKEIRKDAVSSAASFYEREIEAMAKFSHDNYVDCFVRFFGWYENHEKVFIAMEYLEHGDLQKYMNSPFPETEAKQITAQLAEGLECLHANNFAHRDMKPFNVLVVRPRPEWWVKIGDFGISKRIIDTALRTHLGTPGYIAPEVLGFFPLSENGPGSSRDDQGTYGLSVDIWALGAITFHMLAQCSPFPAPYDLFTYVVRETPFPRKVLDNKGVRDEYYDFLEKAMAPSPTCRLTANEVVTHPWLKMPSRLPQASSHLSESVPDIAKSSDIVEDIGVAPIDPVASLMWSTLDSFEAVKLNPEPSRDSLSGSSQADTAGCTSASDAIRPAGGPVPREELDAARVGDNMQLLTIGDDVVKSTIKSYRGPTTDSVSLVHGVSVDSRPVTDINPQIEDNDSSLNLVNEMEGITPQVLSRLSFKGIEDLTARIVAVARQIRKDTEVIKLSLTRQELLTEDEAKGLAEKVRHIHSLTTPEEVKSLVASGAKLCPKDWHDALTAALESDNHKCLIALLQCDANFSFLPRRQSRFMSPLTFAASSGNEAGVWALFSAGASLTPYSDQESDNMLIYGNLENLQIRRAPLIEALTHGHTDIVRFLLANGANPCNFGLVDYGDKRPLETHSPLTAILMTYPRSETQWKCFDILKMVPYKLDENLHYLIKSYMTREYGSDMSWDAFSRAVRELLETGLDPRCKVVFRYMPRRARQPIIRDCIVERLSARELVKRIRSKCDRDKILELLKG